LENEEGDTFSVPEGVPKTQLRQLHLHPGDLVHAYFKKKTKGGKWGKSSKVDEGSVEEIDEADGQVKIGFDDGRIIQTVPTGWIKDVIKNVFTIRAEAAEKRRVVGERDRMPETHFAEHSHTMAQKVETKTRVVRKQEWHLHPGFFFCFTSSLLAFTCTKVQILTPEERRARRPRACLLQEEDGRTRR
jgi:hypothetical protein